MWCTGLKVGRSLCEPRSGNPSRSPMTAAIRLAFKGADGAITEDSMNNTQSASTGQLRRRLTRALVAFGLVVGTMAMTAKPAEAASIVVGCFRPFGSLTAANLPVLLYAVTPSGIVEVPGAGTTTNYSGCMVSFVPAAYQPYYLVMYIDYRTYGRTYWSGITSFASPGNGVSFLNESVSCQGNLCNYY